MTDRGHEMERREVRDYEERFKRVEKHGTWLKGEKNILFGEFWKPSVLVVVLPSGYPVSASG